MALTAYPPQVGVSPHPVGLKHLFKYSNDWQILSGPNSSLHTLCRLVIHNKVPRQPKLQEKAQEFAMNVLGGALESCSCSWKAHQPLEPVFPRPGRHELPTAGLLFLKQLSAEQQGHAGARVGAGHPTLLA